MFLESDDIHPNTLLFKAIAETSALKITRALAEGQKKREKRMTQETWALVAKHKDI